MEVKEKMDKLIQYYKDSGLLIVGMNDSQGVNTTSTFLKKGLLEYLKITLTSKEFTPEVINAFSLTMNKTEHIDYFLKNNISVEEIKLSQMYSAISAFEKVMMDIGFPKTLGQVGNIYRCMYTPKKGDEDKKISTSLQKAKEPVIIYSSAVNDLMREVGSNPFQIKRDYKDRKKRANYYYALSKKSSPSTLQKVMESVERNYETILGINASTDIYTLGSYIPKSFQRKEINIWQEMVMTYNEKLERLCKQYHVTFVDTEKIGKEYNRSENNFHISTAGHNALASHILECMYQNKIANKKTEMPSQHSTCEITNLGTYGIIQDLEIDYQNSLQKAQKLFGRAQKRELEIAKEHKREKEIFEKVLKKRNRHM